MHKHLTHWGRVTHICVGNLTIIGPDNGLSPGRRQAIIWTNAGILLIGHWGTNFSEILIGIHTFSFKKIPLKISSAKWRSFGLGFNVLRQIMPSLHNGCDLFNTRVLPEPMLAYCKFQWKFKLFVEGYSFSSAICKMSFGSGFMG